MTDQVNTPVETESTGINAPQPPAPEVAPVGTEGVNESSERETPEDHLVDSPQEVTDDDQASPKPESAEPESQMSESATPEDLLADSPQEVADDNQASPKPESAEPESQMSEGAISPTPQINDASSAPQTAAADPTAPQFQPISPISVSSSQEPINIDRLMDVNVNITVELGRTTMPIRDVLNLQTGAVVELDRIAGEPVDVFVNDRLLAHGEVVVIDDKFGVRITKLTSKNEK